MITVKVLYFGVAADISGKRNEDLQLPADTTVREASQKILLAYSDLNERSLTYAINQEYADGSETLKDGDELALIPPVSGG